MIVYKGTELDYYEGSIKPAVLKGGLTKIESLSDRTGLVSTQFDLPRTRTNELAFDNVTTEGAQAEAFGDSYISLEGNIVSTGKLYVRGYDNKNFKCLYIGEDTSFFYSLKNKPLYSLFPMDFQFLLSDSNIKNAIENLKPRTLGEGISYHYGHPFMSSLATDGELKRGTASPYFSVRHMLYKMFKDEGYNLNSNFLDSDYGTSLDYTCFDGQHLSSNAFINSGEQIPTTNPFSVKTLDLGTAESSNNSITVSSYGSGSSAGKKYTLVNDVSSLKFKGEFVLAKGEDIEDVQIIVRIFRGLSFMYYSNQLLDNGGLLQEGVNYFEFDLTQDFLAGDDIFIEADISLKSGSSYPLSGASLIVNNFNISHDNADGGDAIYFGNYISKRSQADFLKGVLKQFNLVLDVEGTEAYIELQDEGIEPVGSSPVALPSISDEDLDITDIILDKEDVSVDYIQGSLYYLKQKLASTDYTDSISTLPYQDWGSYLYEVNSFNKSKAEEYESYFTALYDGDSYSLQGFWKGDYATSFDNNISSRFRSTGIFDDTISVNFTNTDNSTTLIDGIVNWSLPTCFSQTYKKLFKNTLSQRRNNKILKVIFKDELGTLVSNRRRYIINGQVYKLIDWAYDLDTKLVKASITMV